MSCVDAIHHKGGLRQGDSVLNKHAMPYAIIRPRYRTRSNLDMSVQRVDKNDTSIFIYTLINNRPCNEDS
eukprot:scaffold787_cov285-Chaetoceros_neogracile.AAC.77